MFHMVENRSEKLIKLLILAAAADGVTDEEENLYLSFIIDFAPEFSKINKQKRDQAISESLDGMTLKMLAEEEPASFTIPDAPSLLGDREVS